MESLSATDVKWLQLAFKLKNNLHSRPVHTSFRVFAIITYVDTSCETKYVTGTNSETTFVGTGICAERAACLQLRTTDCVRVTKIYLVSDSPTELTPGLLCREFLHEFCATSTPVAMAWFPQSSIADSADAPRAEDHVDQWKSRTTTLAELYPFPPLFLHVASKDAEPFGQHLKSKAQSIRSVCTDELCCSCTSASSNTRSKI